MHKHDNVLHNLCLIGLGVKRVLGKDEIPGSIPGSGFERPYLYKR
jgi:hypothetical protein